MNPPFKRVLIANRGEIAVRVARTCKALGIESVAIYSEADKQALHVSFADAAYPVGPARVQDSYLNLDSIVKAIKDSGADAVHPGYGLLSEDPRLSKAVTEAGATFVGPSPEALAALGDKLQARQLARSVGIQTPPGTANALDVGEPEAVTRAASAIGYPLLVKAAAGGGGIGMMPVHSPEQLLQVAETCSKRSQAAFGDGRVYLEKLLTAPRHIEVQIAADAHGTVVSLGERECSVQRRHQKVLEEAPSPGRFLNESFRKTLSDSAVALVKAAQFGEGPYVGLATVEFIVDAASEPADLYFLEVNARLQVEHPVTEMVLGVDLVALQLSLAAGMKIDEQLRERKPNGHAVEARVYAEDPSKKFMPQPGTIEQLSWPTPSASLRVDAGYQEGDVVTPFYDPLIAKIIAHGQDREQALGHLSSALRETHLKLVGPKGLKVSNLSFLSDLVERSALGTGDYTTHLIEEFQKAQD